MLRKRIRKHKIKQLCLGLKFWRSKITRRRTLITSQTYVPENFANYFGGAGYGLADVIFSAGWINLRKRVGRLIFSNVSANLAGDKGNLSGIDMANLGWRTGVKRLTGKIQPSPFFLIWQKRTCDSNANNAKAHTKCMLRVLYWNCERFHRVPASPACVSALYKILFFYIQNVPYMVFLFKYNCINICINIITNRRL